VQRAAAGAAPRIVLQQAEAVQHSDEYLCTGGLTVGI